MKRAGLGRQVVVKCLEKSEVDIFEQIQNEMFDTKGIPWDLDILFNFGGDDGECLGAFCNFLGVGCNLFRFVFLGVLLFLGICLG